MDNNNTENNKKQNNMSAFRNKNPYTMYRIDAKNTFIEFLSPKRLRGEDFYKVGINIVKYNPANSNKTENTVSFYMGIAEFKELLHDIKTFRLQQVISSLKGDYDVCKKWELFAGSSEDNCRKLTFGKSQSANTTYLRIENGRGIKDKNKNIYTINSKTANWLGIPISFSELMRMALQCSDRLLAYEIECQLTGAYTAKQNAMPYLVGDIMENIQDVVVNTVKTAVESILSGYALQATQAEIPATAPHIEDEIPDNDIPVETSKEEDIKAEENNEPAEMEDSFYKYATISTEDIGIPAGSFE